MNGITMKVTETNNEGLKRSYKVIVLASDIEENIELAFFIPLIAAMGGNVGVQSAAIVVQGIANESIRINSIFSKLLTLPGNKYEYELECLFAIRNLGYNITQIQI